MKRKIKNLIKLNYKMKKKLDNTVLNPKSRMYFNVDLVSAHNNICCSISELERVLKSLD